MLGLGNTLAQDFKTVFLDDYSLQFDGTDEYVDCDTIVGNVNVNEGSISLWIKVDETTSTGNIFRMQVDSNNFISIFYHAGSNETRTTYKGGGSAVTAVTAAAIEADNNWHHVVSTWNVGAKQLKLYLDGSLIQTKPNTGSLPTFGGDIGLGTADIGQNTTGSSYFKGFINDVAIFDTTITLADVIKLYNSGKPNDVGIIGAENRLIVYYKFETGRGTIAKDSSPNSTNGTLVNEPTWSTDTP